MQLPVVGLIPLDSLWAAALAGAYSLFHNKSMKLQMAPTMTHYMTLDNSR